MHTPEEKFYTAIAVAAIVLGIIIGYFIITMIRHQRRNVLLYKARIKAEVSTLENERKRMATDLHDELGPLLSAVRIQINHLDTESEHDKKIITIANRHIDDILTKTREISYNLLPNTLVRKGLVIALHEYITRLCDIHELKITLQSNNDHIKLSKEQEINIYRIIQEVTHNTIKHANATELIIRLKTDGEDLLLMTSDNGLGFDYENKLEANKGLGLINLQSRTEILNAKFNYRSDPGQGTQYIFEIPLNEIT
jgi:signal transduction histidine kinase